MKCLECVCIVQIRKLMTLQPPLKGFWLYALQVIRSGILSTMDPQEKKIQEVHKV